MIYLDMQNCHTNAHLYLILLYFVIVNAIRIVSWLSQTQPWHMSTIHPYIDTPPICVPRLVNY